jgi:hypothetical protein
VLDFRQQCWWWGEPDESLKALTMPLVARQRSTSRRSVVPVQIEGRRSAVLATVTTVIRDYA